MRTEEPLGRDLGDRRNDIEIGTPALIRSLDQLLDLARRQGQGINHIDGEIEQGDHTRP